MIKENKCQHFTLTESLVSHAWDYHDEYNKIIGFPENTNNFERRNYSAPKDRRFDSLTKTELKEELREQIRPVEIVLVLAGMYVAHREWIQFEVDYANSLGKPILPIKPWGSQHYPDHLEFAEESAVGWNTNSIVSAIRAMTNHR